MKRTIRVLLIEDSETDAELLLRELRRGGYEPSHHRVQAAPELHEALKESWDLVVSDYSMPAFGAPAALEIVKHRARDLPFIVVSGSIGEDRAVGVLKAGAHDFISKENLSRLLPAIEREMRDAAERRARKAAEDSLRNAEDQLRQSQKLEAIGQLAGGVAHDFNNLLTIINGRCQLAIERLAAEDPLFTELELILKTGERAAALTRQLLAFSRKQILAPRTLNLNSIVSEMQRMLSRLISEDIELLTVLEPLLGAIKADPSQVEQVIMNLVVNARDAMPQGGRLTIETRNAELDDAYARSHPSVKPGAYVMIAVADTGVGMDEATQAKIFDPFFTTKELGRGTGLGLSTVYGIVRQSEGHIWVYSVPGQGSVLKVYFPRVYSAVDTVVKAELAKTAEAGKATILVAEDEQAIRDLIREILTVRGYTVLTASDGEEAFRLAQTHSGTIDLLMADVVMPKLSGKDLAARVVALRPEIQTLYMSGFSDDTLTNRGVLSGDVEFIEKPFTLDTLTDRVKSILAKGKSKP
ncbi:MAG: response regulator [Planctomycetes bacterium]|nr:response regulator [Planctomycetota bacterium]